MESYVLNFILISGIYCFNLDTDNVVTFRGQEGTNFGYSTVMFSSNDGQKWILVGATEANFTNDVNIMNPGNIYKCNLDFTSSTTDDCTPLNIRTNDNVRWPEEPGYEEDHELLGASMTLIDQSVVTCAPLWKNMIPIKSAGFVHPIGRCFNVDRNSFNYTSKQFKNTYFKQYQPENQNELTFEIAQIGFSISNKKYEDLLLPILIGAPGFFENKGGFLEYSATETSEQFFDIFTHQAFAEDQKKSIAAGTFLGYSITTGKLSDSDDICPSVIVLGAPHYSSSDGIVGAVLVLCAEVSFSFSGKSLEVKKQFFGRKSGSGFGTAVAFDDINGDGLDDLLVGSPLHFDNEIDEGAVFVFYGSNDAAVLLSRSNQVLMGSNKPQSRFGTAVECVEDVNKDGYKDIVVGAPYEDDMKGTVYLYHGGASRLTLAQKIQSRDFGSDLKSFGWYISATYDIDNNNYPDVLVGSYMSNAVSVLRARPIIKLTSTVGIEPILIPLNSTGLQCQQKDFKPCVTVSLCFSYSGENVPDSIMVAYNITADLLMINANKPSRVNLFIDGINQDKTLIQGQTVQVDKGTGNCVAIYAVVQNVDRQFYESLEKELVIEASYGLSSKPVPGEVQPILNNIPTIKQTSANFSTGCAGICHPDLQLDMSLSPNQIILGVTTETVLQIRVTNTGDMSHGTQITIETSNNTKYIGYSQPDNEITERVICSQIINTTRVVCDLPATLFQQQKAILYARFVVARDILLTGERTLGSFDHNIVFTCRAETASSSPDMNPADNIKRLLATVKLDSRVELTGKSIPEQLTVSEKADKVLSFTHRYDVINKGPSPLYEGYIHICLPVQTQAGKPMMKKSQIKIIVNSPYLTWKVIQFPGEVIYNPDSSHHSHASSTTLGPRTTTIGVSTSTLPERESVVPRRKRRETTLKLVQDQQYQRTFLEISCDTIDQSSHGVIEIKLNSMEKDDIVSFDVPVNISEKSLIFTQVSGIYYKSKGEVITDNNDRYIIRAGNTTHFDISSEIFPHEVTVESKKVNIWIIIGGCVGGLILLIVLGIVLWKCGFFQRKKKDDLRKWKRQSGYYAKRQSARAGSTKSSNYKTVGDW